MPKERELETQIHKITHRDTHKHTEMRHPGTNTDMIQAYKYDTQRYKEVYIHTDMKHKYTAMSHTETYM